MFNVNPLEILVLGGLFLLLFGPEKLPEIALQLGRFVREIRELSATASAEISRELHRAAEENRELTGDIRTIGDEARRLLQGAGDSVHNSVTQAVGGLGVSEALDWTTPMADPAAPEVRAASPAAPAAAPAEQPADPVLAAIGGEVGGPAGPGEGDEDPTVAAILADAARQTAAAGEAEA